MLIKTDQDTIQSYFEDSSNLKGGHAQAVVFPDTVDELASFFTEANSKKMPVTISGGGTGTTGSRIPFGGYVVSMEKFNKICGVSQDLMSGVVQAGVPVDDFKDACGKKGLFFSSHPTEKSAHVGGTVATNASGARSFKYGATRRYVKRLKMVLANGEIFDIGRGERTITGRGAVIKLSGGTEIKVPMPTYRMPTVKNSAGYYVKDGMDLIDLFIGQEGTLSAITQIEFELVKMPAGIFSCFVFFKKDEDAWAFSEEARRVSRSVAVLADGGKVDALSIEYFDRNALRLLRARNRNVPDSADAAIFFEQEIDRENKEDIADKWLKLILSHGASLDDTWVAMNEREADGFTALRHCIPEAINEIVRRSPFQKLSTDIAVPDDKFAQLMNFYTEAFRKESLEHVIFGHIGECHVHINILPKSEEELKRAGEASLLFIKKGISLGGTISAEHGVGKTKHKYLELMYGREGILQMARIKKAFDPNCILGLDNIFPKEYLSLV